MSHKEYSKITHSVPYFYKIIKNNQQIFFFGTKHSNNPKDPIFGKLELKWIEFNKKVKGDITVVLEGKAPDNIYLLDDLIKISGEVGAGTFFARQAKAELLCPEPSKKEIIDFLLQTFSKEEILYFFEAIAIKHWLHFKKDSITLRDFLKKHDKQYQEFLRWPNLEISEDLIKTLHFNIFKNSLDLNDIDFLSKITDPGLDFSVINQVSRAQSEFRNQHIFQKIKELWKSGKNLFIIYGAGHAVMLEPAIKSLSI